MPDIALCQGGECPRKYECGRFLAEPTADYQAYHDWGPSQWGGDVCPGYWPLAEFPYRLRGASQLKARGDQLLI